MAKEYIALAVHRWRQVLERTDRKYDDFDPESSEAKLLIGTIRAAHTNVIKIKRKSAEMLTITDEEWLAICYRLDGKEHFKAFFQCYANTQLFKLNSLLSSA
jgi:hypothetical protein